MSELITPLTDKSRNGVRIVQPGVPHAAYIDYSRLDARLWHYTYRCCTPSTSGQLIEGPVKAYLQKCGLTRHPIPSQQSRPLGHDILSASVTGPSDALQDRPSSGPPSSLLIAWHLASEHWQQLSNPSRQKKYLLVVLVPKYATAKGYQTMRLHRWMALPPLAAGQNLIPVRARANIYTSQLSTALFRRTTCKGPRGWALNLVYRETPCAVPSASEWIWDEMTRQALSVIMSRYKEPLASPRRCITLTKAPTRT